MEQQLAWKRCGRPSSHDAWAFHFLGWMAKSPEPAARRAVLEALESAAGSYELPVAAISVWCDLMSEDLDDDAKF